jgi:hypothetical protein
VIYKCSKCKKSGKKTIFLRKSGIPPFRGKIMVG